MKMRKVMQATVSRMPRVRASASKSCALSSLSGRVRVVKDRSALPASISTQGVSPRLATWSAARRPVPPSVRTRRISGSRPWAKGSGMAVTRSSRDPVSRW